MNLEIEKQQENSFLMFSGGPRICPGRKVAIIELKTLITLIYRKFDVELVDMRAPLNIETSTITFYFMNLEIEKQQENSFLMFSGGPRICPGRKVAIIELKTLITLIYRKFDVELVDMRAPLNIETSTITFCKELNIKLIPRELKTNS
ncbi:hypothetical protein Glove_89g69 [Diversispora epigaea]|uniref:Cytochrome P450 n=1 Tax=Diversispora epigaea TaxID=1348612 RepID=A0A397JGA0_9GLOM|nr:hypothetical protein Glove_89g69 [Diversispora epigaea]